MMLCMGALHTALLPAAACWPTVCRCQLLPADPCCQLTAAWRQLPLFATWAPEGCQPAAAACLPASCNCLPAASASRLPPAACCLRLWLSAPAAHTRFCILQRACLLPRTWVGQHMAAKNGLAHGPAMCPRAPACRRTCTHVTSSTEAAYYWPGRGNRPAGISRRRCSPAVFFLGRLPAAPFPPAGSPCQEVVQPVIQVLEAHASKSSRFRGSKSLQKTKA